MKTINSFRSKLLAFTLALVASVSTFAYDYHGDLLCYNVLTDSTVAVTGQSEYKTMPRYEYLPENLVIPSEVTLQGKAYKVVSIDQWAFYACTMLKSVTIPSSVTFIGLSAFQYCENLVNVDIPTSVTTVEGSAFSYTKWYDNLPDGEVYINNTLYRYKGTAPENTQIVVKDGTTRIAGFTFWNQSNIVAIELPQTLTDIEHGAFEGCTQLSSILIPKNVTFIGCSAFADCLSLNTIICYAIEPPTISSNTFFGSNPIYNNPTIYVPAESVEAYKNAEHWKWFTKVLPIEPTSYKSQWCDTWNVFVENGSVYPPHEETYRYQLAKDTVIGEHTYTAVVQKEINDAFDAPHYVAAVRFTDDRKVYIYYDNAEYLLYDFNVQEGDELEVFAGINNYTSEIKTYKCTVTGVEQYACVGCPATITLEVHNHPDDFREFYRQTQWIEGVGDINGFLNGINGYINIPGNAAEYLLCAYQGDELKYTGDLYEEYGCGDDAELNPEDLFPTLWGLQRTSCDEWYDGCGENKSYLFAPKEVKEINGKLYLKCGGVFLREEDSKVLIYSFPYEKDFVLYDYTLEVGGTLQNLGIDIYSFPELEYAAVVDYMAYEDYDVETDEFIIKKEPLGSKRVQEVSTITLLDGKEYKRWLFGNDWENGDYYIEGIGNVGGSFGGDYIDIANPYGIPTCYLGERLVCASKNGQLLYQMDDTEMERLGAECLCDYNSGPKKDNAKNGKIGGRPTPTQWNMLEVETKEMDGTPTILRAETFSYTLENDSIVAKGKTFYQLARQSTKDTAITKSFVGALHFGEDEDNRVYFLRDGVEYVLYDFTAEPGDSIEIFAGINNYPQETTYTHVVTGKDTLENGACRMLLEVVFPEETASVENAQKVWLAGLGSIDGIVHNAAQRTSDAHAAPSRSAHSSNTQTSVMLCAWRDDNCLYTTNHPEYDTFGCVYNQDPTAVEDVQTSGDKYQKIIRDGHLYILRDNKLYDVLGTPMN